MNWKQINDRYPKAFLEWVNEGETEKIFSLKAEAKEDYDKDDECCFLCNGQDYKWMFGEYVYKLPYYFEKHGITITPMPFVLGDSKERNWCVCSFLDFKWQGYFMEGRQIKTFPDRLTATIAGAEKAFEIREAQLNN